MWARVPHSLTLWNLLQGFLHLSSYTSPQRSSRVCICTSVFYCTCVVSHMCSTVYLTCTQPALKADGPFPLTAFFFSLSLSLPFPFPAPPSPPTFPLHLLHSSNFAHLPSLIFNSLVFTVRLFHLPRFLPITAPQPPPLSPCASTITTSTFLISV